MTDFLGQIEAELDEIRAAGLFKHEREIQTAQGTHIGVNGREVINLCANNYLGLANHPSLISAAQTAMETHGFGMASVRFICGTQDLHRQLEEELAAFLEQEDAILFAACFDANGALFEPLMTSEDAIVSDALNHASIIDGIRLSKANRYRYNNSDMQDLENQLKAARSDGARRIMIATDGVFSMDGYFANLKDIRALADRYEALLMVDDCHSTGFIGPQGRGTPAHFGVKADVITGTLGKALGGALGGYIAGPKPIVDLMRQRARPYLFSNALPPAIVAAGIEALRLVREGDQLRESLFNNSRYWRAGLEELGFDVLPGEHPIIPVMLYDAKLAQNMAARLFELGVFVSGFFFPVVPQGQARIRTQMNAALTKVDLDHALGAFETAGRETGALS